MGAPQANGHVNGENKAQVLIIGSVGYRVAHQQPLKLTSYPNQPLQRRHRRPLAIARPQEARHLQHRVRERSRTGSQSGMGTFYPLVSCFDSVGFLTWLGERAVSTSVL